MQLAAKLDLTVHQLDVKTAYLNAPIDCEIYLEQEEGYEVPGKDKKLVYTYLRNKRMRRCWVAPPPIIFERLQLPQQIIYRRKENLSESPNHQKY